MLHCKISLTLKILLLLSLKRKCGEIVNPSLEDQKYLFVLTSSKKKISIAKIRMNSHELHSETCPWEVPKTPWVERIYENINIEDKNHFLLECPRYNHILIDI